MSDQDLVPDEFLNIAGISLRSVTSILNLVKYSNLRCRNAYATTLENYIARVEEDRGRFASDVPRTIMLPEARTLARLVVSYLETALETVARFPHVTSGPDPDGDFDFWHSRADSLREALDPLTGIISIRRYIESYLSKATEVDLETEWLPSEIRIRLARYVLNPANRRLFDRLRNGEIDSSELALTGRGIYSVDICLELLSQHLLHISLTGTEIDSNRSHYGFYSW